MSSDESSLAIIDLLPLNDTFLQDVLDGLRQRPKTLPCKYFYDERGCWLFDEICELDEYYLTRTELSIMSRDAQRMADRVGPECMLIEYGSGSSIKTRILLDHLQRPAAYVPVEIAREHLEKTATELAGDYPELEVMPICADFTNDFELPASDRTPRRCVVYFPGSTIGNFQPDSAKRLFRQIAQQCGRGGGLLIGVDLKKDVDVLERAYNDRRGVTAEFNLNLLQRINRELDADFDTQQFAHHAFYNPERGRIEIYLKSLSRQSMSIDGEQFDFGKHELLLTEHSHKYDLDDIRNLAAATGMEIVDYWTDPNEWFGVFYLQT